MSSSSLTMDLDINLTSSCRINVLLIPIYPIKHSVFRRYTELFREFTTIQLNDVTPGNKSKQEVFNATKFQQGHIYFEFTTHYSGDRDNLIDLQPHRRLFGVIGIMDCQEWKERPLQNGYQQYLTSLTKYPSTIVTRCFAFDPAENQADDINGLIMIPDVGDKKFYIATLLCDFTSDILSQFSFLVKDLTHQLQSESSPRNTNYASPTQTNQRHSAPQQAYYPSTIESPSKYNIPDTNSPSTYSSSFSVGQSSKFQKRTPGRIKKLYADFYLLSGQLTDALALYIQAMDMTKITSDHVWLASAIEGYVCTTLLLEQLQLGDEATSGKLSTISTFTKDSTQTSTTETPSSPESTLTIPFVLEQYNTLLQLYSEDIYNPAQRNTKHTTDGDNTTSITASANLAYAEACIKVARFLLTVYLNGNLDRISRNLLVNGWITSPCGQTPYSSTSSPLLSPSLPETPVSMSQGATLDQHKLLAQNDCSIERWDIGFWTTRVWEASLGKLALVDQIYLMTEMASIYTSIGYHRKTAWLKYQIIQLVLPILLQRQRKSKQDTRHENSNVTFPNIDRQDILMILEWIWKVYGVTGGDPQNGDILRKRQKRLRTKIGTVGWPSLQLTVLRKCIIITESLYAYTDMLYYATTLMKNMHLYISKQEQIQLSNSIQRLSSLRKLSTIADTENDDSQEHGINYWGVSIVIGIRAAQSIPRKQLHKHPLSKEEIANIVSGTPHAENKHQSSADSSITTDNDPFIYNPFTQKKDQEEQILLIKDEIAELHVSLLNPFGFDLELQNIQLCTSGVPFQAIPYSTILPAYGTSNLCISGIPRAIGTLLILGCAIKIVGFVEQDFLLDQGTSNKQSLDATNQKEFNVVAEEPLMKVKSTSLLQDAIMLFEGERSQISITLENIGNIPVDFIALSFTDDASDNSILGSGLSMEKQYELERIFLDRKVFRWQGNIERNDQTIGEHVWVPPGSNLEISLGIYGRNGCTRGTIQVDYGYLNINENNQKLQQLDLSTIFYTRQLYIPILITVYCHLKPQYWDLFYIQLGDLSSYKAARSTITGGTMRTRSRTKKHNTDPLPIEQVLEDLAQQKSGTNIIDPTFGPHGQNEYCVATIDIQNRWRFPFRVCLSIDNADGGKTDDANSIIQPGTTTRMLLPVKRFILPENIINQPITLETQKQRVVTQNQELPTSLSSLSLAEQKNYRRLQLELFWYRENLLERIKAIWIKHDTDDGARDMEDEVNQHGELDLRPCLGLTFEQLSVLKLPDVNFTLNLDGYGVKHFGFKHFVCQTGQRVMLTITVKNMHLERPTKFILRIQPARNINGGTELLDLGQDELLMEGISQVILPEISLNQQALHTIPLCFLANGRFKILYHAQNIMTKTTYYDQENVVVDAVDTLD